MYVIESDQARQVVVLKRSFGGIANTLYELP
jgi:NAD/NADP transhydrogenase beta subunit